MDFDKNNTNILENLLELESSINHVKLQLKEMLRNTGVAESASKRIGYVPYNFLDVEAKPKQGMERNFYMGKTEQDDVVIREKIKSLPLEIRLRNMKQSVLTTEKSSANLNLTIEHVFKDHGGKFEYEDSDIQKVEFSQVKGYNPLNNEIKALGKDKKNKFKEGLEHKIQEAVTSSPALKEPKEHAGGPQEPEETEKKSWVPGKTPGK